MSLFMNFLTPASGKLRPMWFGLIPCLRRVSLIAIFSVIAAPALAVTYSDNGDGTVTDPTTGLTWMRCSVGQSWTGSSCAGDAIWLYWPGNALTGSATFAGYSDWRVPSLRELLTIVDRSKFNPAIDVATFPNTPMLPFWSATSSASVPSAAWYIHFGDGHPDYALKLSTFPGFVRLVRGGQSTGLLNLARPSSDYVDQGDGTVTHTPTGLMWKRCAEGESWTGATCTSTSSSTNWYVANAASSSFAGYSDWRLPSVEELLSLVDYNYYRPAFNATVFPAMPTNWKFWSSSSHAADSSYVWYVDLGDGYVDYDSKLGAITAGVRLVRAGSGSASTTSTTATTSASTTTTAAAGTTTTATATTSTTIGGTTSTTQAAAAAIPMVAAGKQFALALKADGSMSAWGRNTYGQLGNGQAAMRLAPAKVEGIDRITAAVAGNGSTLALRDDGTVWGWGFNANGNLGDGTTENKSHPVAVIGVVGTVKAIDLSNVHALAVTTDGKVWAWGWGAYGQLGNGSTADRSSAIHVSGLPAVDKVAAGDSHSLALASDGTVWAWGDNSRGQLGDGSNNSRLTPVRVGALSNIVAISARATSNLALDTSGRVWAWGFGGWGALGDGTYYDRTTPFIVPGLPQIISIVAANKVSATTAVDGSVWIWGDNGSGQFGNVGFVTQLTPAKVSALAGFSRFSVGARNAFAYGPGGALQAWGENSYGQLGVGDTNDRSSPASVTAPVQFAQVSAGVDHTVAIATDGSVWAWGANGDGQLADGAASVSNRPVEVRGPGDSIAVSAGQFHALALSGNGSVWAWGANGNGALGSGSRRDSALPQRVSALPAMAAIAAGNEFSLALEQNGTVWSWGNGPEGQLGDGLAGRAQLTPQKLTTISGVKQLSANSQVLALRQDGSVWTWGANTYGQLGDGGTANRSTPAQVAGLSNVVAVAAGGFFSLALDRSGNVWAWGLGGHIGDGTLTDRYTPVPVLGLSNVIAIAAGEHSGYAITSDGRLWAWGANIEGELGTASPDRSSLLAQAIDGLTGFQGIAGGSGSAVALRTDGTVWAWGRNFEGQLGDATFAQRNAPVLTMNATVDGPLDLNPQLAKNIPPEKMPPFFAVATRAGDLSRFSVSTTTRFNAADVGLSGAVFVTAAVPPGSLVPAQSPMNAVGTSVSGAGALTATSPFALIQLTPSGWQPVVNGQLLPYASGVLGDQLAAQTILNSTNATNLNGAQFCIGYGTSAEQMVAVGAMRAVATIPDPGASSPDTASCIVGAALISSTSTTTSTTSTSTTTAQTTTTTASTTSTTLAGAGAMLDFVVGWNLVGNGVTGSLDAVTVFGDASKVGTVWKWIAQSAKWAFYAPSLVGQALNDYAISKGYDVLTTIDGGEGFWINAKTAFSAPLPSGSPIDSATFQGMASGWNLIAVGDNKSPRAFNNAIGLTPPVAGDIPLNLITLWAWGAAQANWYFYAPSLDNNGGLAAYVASKGYIDFGAGVLNPTTGFWVNKP